MEQISVREAAERKECTVQAVRNAVKAGYVEAVQIGRAYIVLVNEKFEAWQPNRERQQIGRDSQKA